MQYLLWSPAIYGPDENWTCKYRKCECNDKGYPILFDNMTEAAKHFEAIQPRVKRRLRVVRTSGLVRRLRLR